jgi:hypothetical protein
LPKNPDVNYIIGSLSADTTPEVCNNMRDDIICSNENIVITKEMFMAILNDRQEMMKIIKSLSEQQAITTTINDHSTNNTNCHNPTFNMNMFLNEKCKYAMNMKYFLNSIQLNMTDLEYVDRIGYVD